MTTGAANWAISKTVRINATLSVEMTCGPGGFVCEWSPGPPRKLTRNEIRYRQGRDDFLAEVAVRLGGNVVVAEL
jgi:hypothetical protein